MPVEQKKAMVDESDQVSISKQCDLLDINRSTYYYKSQQINDNDLEIMNQMDKLHLEDPTRGTRRMSDELQKLNYKNGRQHTRKLMQIMRMKTVYCRPRTTVIKPGEYKYPYLLRNLTIIRSNQVWAIDITYVPMQRGYMFLLVIFDVYSRFVVGWSVSNTMETSWIIKILEQSIKKYGIPEIINSDQGSQFTSQEYVSYIKSLETCKISMDGKGRAIDNVFVERFFRTIKYDKLYLIELQNGQHVIKVCEEFIQYYNCRRGHSSLQKRTPENVYKSAA
jgi:putative transposase